jgi:hypothetical protein
VCACVRVCVCVFVCVWRGLGPVGRVLMCFRDPSGTCKVVGGPAGAHWQALCKSRPLRRLLRVRVGPLAAVAVRAEAGQLGRGRPGVREPAGQGVGVADAGQHGLARLAIGLAGKARPKEGETTGEGVAFFAALRLPGPMSRRVSGRARGQARHGRRLQRPTKKRNLPNQERPGRTTSAEGRSSSSALGLRRAAKINGKRSFGGRIVQGSEMGQTC